MLKTFNNKNSFTCFREITKLWAHVQHIVPHFLKLKDTSTTSAIICKPDLLHRIVANHFVIKYLILHIYIVSLIDFFIPATCCMMNGSMIRQTPITCTGHSRPVVDIEFSDITDDLSYYLISASKDGKPQLREGGTGTIDLKKCF